MLTKKDKTMMLAHVMLLITISMWMIYALWLAFEPYFWQVFLPIVALTIILTPLVKRSLDKKERLK